MKLLFALLSAIINPTWSPDSTKCAFTRDNDLYVADLVKGDTLRLSNDGSELILNGYASWVYYEEIFGRSSNYKAFWWSPDSKKLAWYRFDDSNVTCFPIYSAAPEGDRLWGSLRRTRYPLAGEPNPGVKLFISDLSDGISTVTAFDEKADVYYGTPFWGRDSRELFVSRMPRRQNHLDLFAVSASDASRRLVYKEDYPTWIEWIEGMLFTDEGLYMARDFETGWQQIYFLSYDGKTLRRLTEGRNWGVELKEVDSRKGLLWFTAFRDSRIHPALYRLNLRSGKITALTDPSQYARNVEVDSKGNFTADCSTSGAEVHLIKNQVYDLYGLMSRPEGFDPSKKYPVIMKVYGGPGIPRVRDFKGNRDATDDWCRENGIITIVVDPRSSGENGRSGMDCAFKGLTVTELEDYIAWAEYLSSLPYVDASRIGVEGFSFGGTVTAMLVLRYPEYFRCGIAGGGVYDWRLYDSHYTERYMCTPQENPDGYRKASVLSYATKEGISPAYRPGSLRLTHGTGDDNVHFQNTLLLMDALQRAGTDFGLMLYPDGMHGYRGYQRAHDVAQEHKFWTEHFLRNLQKITSIIYE